MSNDDTPIVVLMPVVLNGRRTAAVPGSIAIQAGCGHETWISPSGASFHTVTQSRTLCVPCAYKLGEVIPDMIAAIPGAEDELVAAYGERGRRMYHEGRANLTRLFSRGKA